jgi:hypothetical protein
MDQPGYIQTLLSFDIDFWYGATTNEWIDIFVDGKTWLKQWWKIEKIDVF